MVVAPILNGGMIENRWQPISAATWCGPSSRSTNFMAAKIGRPGQPTQNPGGRGGTTVANALIGSWDCADGLLGARAAALNRSAMNRLAKAPIPSAITLAVYSPAIRNTAL